VSLDFEIVLNPAFGRKRCPICRARPYTRCRELRYGRRIVYRETRHYERYAMERQTPPTQGTEPPEASDARV
jgi:hypothetical protein